MKYLLLIIIFYLSVINESFSGENLYYRLPTTVQPITYSLRIHPDLDRDTFKGDISINVKVTNLISYIRLHNSNLNITKLYLDQKSDGISYRIYKEYEILEIYYMTNRTITPGNHRIRILYEGNLLNDNVGFIKAKFLDREPLSYLAVTDFQPTYARRAFPCFDEPSFKAIFHLTLIAPNSSYTALSNMRAIEQFESDDGIVYKFKSTCLMSPYLLAFAITQYTSGKYITEIGCRQIPIKIYSLEANDVDNKKPMEIAAAALKFYVNYTNFNYPLPKIDFIEYERNLSEATENWGLITTKTGALSPKLKMYQENQITDIITHEIAHFWFGNLVTNDWWNDIWLQEGFAVFMGIKAQDSLQNNEELSKMFPITTLQSIYLLDFQATANPLVTDVNSRSEIEQHFNDITYIKGAALFRMIEEVLGTERFQIGVRKYLQCFAYKTVTTEDLIALFQSVYPYQEFREFIESYTFQNKCPIIMVEEDEHVYTLKMHNYSLDDGTRYKWTVPLTYITDLNPKPTLVWFYKDMDKLKIRKRNEKWIKFNYRHKGYYMINYNIDLWTSFLLNKHQLDVYEKTHLLLESINLYLLDIIPCEIPLKFMQVFNQTTEQITAIPITIFMYYAQDEIKMYDRQAFRLLENYITKILGRDGPTKSKKKREEDVLSYLINKSFKIPDRIEKCIGWINNNLKFL